MSPCSTGPVRGSNHMPKTTERKQNRFTPKEEQVEHTSVQILLSAHQASLRCCIYVLRYTSLRIWAQRKKKSEKKVRDENGLTFMKASHLPEYNGTSFVRMSFTISWQWWQNVLQERGKNSQSTKQDQENQFHDTFYRSVKFHLDPLQAFGNPSEKGWKAQKDRERIKK